MSPLEIFLMVLLLVAFVGGHFVERAHAQREYRQGRHVACFGCIVLAHPASARLQAPNLQQAEAEAAILAAIDSLPCASWSELEGDSSHGDVQSCALCLEVFQQGCLVTQLPTCGHRFHKLCVVRWLKSRRFETRRCPLCNTDPLGLPSATCASAASSESLPNESASIAAAALPPAPPPAPVVAPPPASGATTWSTLGEWLSSGSRRLVARGGAPQVAPAVSSEPDTLAA